MACTYLFSDSYDYGTVPFDTIDMSVLGDFTCQALGHTGTYALAIDNAGWCRYAITGTPDNLSVGIWVDLVNYFATNDILRIKAHLTTGEYIELRWDSVGSTFDAYVDGVKVADGAVPVPVNDWFHIQFYTFIDNVGFIRTKIDGAADINFNGDTLPIGAAASIDYLYFSKPAGGSQFILIDDLIAGTGDWTGDIRVEYLVPNADTGVEQWSRSAGADSFALVDEVPANDADYLYTDTDALSTELALEDWDGVDKTPILVTAIARADEDAATAESLEVGVDSGGVDDTTQYVMTSAKRYYRHAMVQNPDGPAIWDDAAIDALLHRIESVI